MADVFTIQTRINRVDALIAEYEAAKGMVSHSSAVSRTRFSALNDLYDERRKLELDLKEATAIANSGGGGAFFTGRQAGRASGSPF